MLCDSARRYILADIQAKEKYVAGGADGLGQMSPVEVGRMLSSVSGGSLLALLRVGLGAQSGFGWARDPPATARSVAGGHPEGLGLSSSGDALSISPAVRRAHPQRLFGYGWARYPPTTTLCVAGGRLLGTWPGIEAWIVRWLLYMMGLGLGG